MLRFSISNEKYSKQKRITHNPSQNTLRPIYEIGQSRTVMEKLIVDFVQLSLVKF